MDLQAHGICKRFFRKSGGSNTFEAVSPTDLLLPEGTLTVLLGRSGSGKTTLLNLLSGLLVPTEGTVRLGDTDLYAMDDQALSRFRNQHIGVIPQGHAALYSLSVAENVAFPAGLYGGRPDAMDAACCLLERFGIGQLKDVSPSELSGGELRRMAIARALHQDAPLLLADEPTGDLDDENTARVLAILRDAAHRDGKTVLLVSHEPDAARYADRLLTLDAGRLTEG